MAMHALGSAETVECNGVTMVEEWVELRSHATSECDCNSRLLLDRKKKKKKKISSAPSVSCWSA